MLLESIGVIADVMRLLLRVANRAMVTSHPSLFIYLSLSLHLSVALTQMHCQLFAFGASNICSACCLCLFQTLQLHIAHGRLSSRSQIFCLSVSNFSFFPHSFFFSLIPLSLNVRVLIVYRNHKFGCHSGA